MPDALREEYAVIRFSTGTDQPLLALNAMGAAGWVMFSMIAPTQHTREAWFRREIGFGA